ncbi:PREDICTED: ankyrin repeat, PH and SEC7 domain containing protein secG-like [Acropora digitifera]|uniref:ankyrin repeat, PH and SEC7 domain containing protein secG-like n=1 Tax=Acropora digitifera TaxID=70779 RepID=UPI00077ADB34|nr:PREDICTED: ankyrin repeat, PH and SEC7 domain containing protein secG-like [Acropora digitifera]
MGEGTTEEISEFQDFWTYTHVLVLCKVCFCLLSLAVRCVSGSTLLHTASFFGAVPVIKTLLSEGLDVNILDYKGLTPLHRARDGATVELLLEVGSNIDSVDHDGNTPLHVKCYGESGEATDLECIEKLLMKEAPLNTRNNRDLMPIHCCAMQGRIDAIQALLFFDTAGSIKQSLETEDEVLEIIYIYSCRRNCRC